MCLGSAIVSMMNSTHSCDRDLNPAKANHIIYVKALINIPFGSDESSTELLSLFM